MFGQVLTLADSWLENIKKEEEDMLLLEDAQNLLLTLHRNQDQNHAREGQVICLAGIKRIGETFVSAIVADITKNVVLLHHEDEV